MGVEVAEVVGRDGAEFGEQPARQLDVPRELLSVLRKQIRQHVLAVEQHATRPREVVEPHLVDDHTGRLHAQPAGKAALETDRDVAETDGSVAAVEEGARHDADGVGEVDDPGVRRPDLPYPLRDLEHNRDGAHRLREAARAGRLLSDAAAGERRRLVVQPRLLPPDPDLDQDVAGIRDRGVEIAGHLEPARITLPRKHSSRHASDDLAPPRIHVLKHEFVDVEACQSGDELRRVRGSTADDCDLHSG